MAKWTKKIWYIDNIYIYIFILFNHEKGGFPAIHDTIGGP